MSSQYHCFCVNRIAVVNAKFRAFDANGEKGKEIELLSGGEGQLALADPAENTVKIEYWDVGWTGGHTYGPINSGDQVVIEGVSKDFQVTINGKKADPIDAS